MDSCIGDQPGLAVRPYGKEYIPGKISSLIEYRLKYVRLNAFSNTYNDASVHL